MSRGTQEMLVIFEDDKRGHHIAGNCLALSRCSGKIEFVSLTAETLEGGLEVMRKSFFIEESVSIAVELFNHPRAIKELEELTLRAARDGVSIVAIDKETGLVVAAAFNKLQVPASPGEENYFENYSANCKEASSKCLVNFMIEADAQCDLFKHYDVDCLLEIMFAATSPEYRNKKIAGKLFAYTLDLGRRLKNGENVRVSLTGESLDLEPRPKVVSAICTSYITQKIARALKFDLVVEIDYNRWSFNGKTFGERIGPLTPNTTVDAFRL